MSMVSWFTNGTVLEAAAKVGNENLIIMLLTKSVKVDTNSGEYYTTLRATIATDHLGVVKLLLEAGANPNMKTEASHSTKANRYTIEAFNSAAEIAAESANITMFELLLDHGMELSPDVLENTFAKASGAPGLEDKLKMIVFLVSKGADIKKYGVLAAFFASDWNKTVEPLQKLISLGTPLDFALTGYIGSALMHAIERGRKEIFQVLLNAGANVNLGAGDSGTALITAIDKVAPRWRPSC